METQPAVPGGAAETLAAAAEEQAKATATAKRARKRSRYLSSDYDTAILVDDHSDHDIAADSPGKGNEEEDAGALLLRLQQAKVGSADLLAALLRSAASPCGSSQGPGVVFDAGLLLRFFALHRASELAADCKNTSTTTGHPHSKGTAAPAPAGHVLPNPCRAMVAVAADGCAGTLMGHAHAAHHIGAANAAAAPAQEDGPNKSDKKVTLAFDGCIAAAAAADFSAQDTAHGAMEQAYDHHIGPAYATPPAAEAGRKRGRKKKVTSAPDAHNAVGSSAQRATGIANGFNSAPKRAKKKKARSSSEQGQHPGKPVALLLEFAKGGTAAIHPPSREDLVATFRGFGSLIESDTEFTARRARLVFGSSTAAEAAYSCAHTLGTFSGRRLQYLRPPPLVPKIPLMDVRKNLERMIASLTGPSSLGGEGALDLAGQMLCLMAKVDKTLRAAGAPGPSTAPAAHRQRY